MGHLPDDKHLSHPAEHAAREWGPAVFVWGLWVGLFVGQLVGVGRYAVNVPYWDDWFNVPFLTGKEPITLGWLWDQTPGAETRTPLNRVLFVALFKLGGDDLRTLLYFNVLVLAAVSFALTRTVARVRGRPSYTDAFFPCLLLHWGQAEMVLWPTMIYIMLPLALAGSCVLLIVSTCHRLTLPRTVLGGFTLLLLPLCGTSGIVFVPFVGLWLAWMGLRHWRSTARGRKTTALTAEAFVGATMLLTAGFFLGEYERGEAAKQSLADQAQGALKVLAMILGPAARTFWPWTGWLMSGCLFLTAAWLAWAWVRTPPERPRALGLLAVLTVGVGLAGLLGWKRPESWCLLVYYGTLPLLSLCSAYFTVCLYSPPRLQVFLQVCLLALSGGLLSLNVHEGSVFAWGRREALAGLEQEIHNGTPLSILTRNHAAAVFWNPADEGVHVFHQKFFESLQDLHEGQVGVFSHLRFDKAHKVPLHLKPLWMGDLTWKQGTARGEGSNSWVAFSLPSVPWVSGLRIRYQHSNSKRGPSYFRYSGDLTPYFQVEWKKTGEADYAPANRYLDVENNVGPDDEQVLTIWVHDTIDQVRIRPDRRPFVCRIAEITILVPAEK